DLPTGHGRPAHTMMATQRSHQSRRVTKPPPHAARRWPRPRTVAGGAQDERSAVPAVERSLASVGEWAEYHVDVGRQRPRDLATLLAEWDDLVDRSPDPSPWQRPGWVLAWWRAFGRGSLRVWALRRNGR